MHGEVDSVSQKRRVLVADDQRPTRRGLHALLNLLPGVEWVGEAADGCEAVSLAIERRPDVVLMDVRMPVMDGIEAARRIKSQRPEVKVIMLTIYAEYQAEALAAGADIFLVKGEPSEALRSAICTA
jgi:DNA-binding NarL/FixJ family response regulator